MSSFFRDLNGGIGGAMRRMDDGQRAGIVAQQAVVKNAWKREMLTHPRAGFTTGNFSVSYALNSITSSEPVKVGMDWIGYVGTAVRYHLFWELGHHNLFTRQYERVPTLMPAVTSSQEDQRAAFQRAFLRAVTSLGGGLSLAGGDE